MEKRGQRNQDYRIASQQGEEAREGGREKENVGLKFHEKKRRDKNEI